MEKCSHIGCKEDGPFGERWPLVTEPRYWCREHLPPEYMKGFISTLSPEQREAALAYRGDDTIG